MIVYLHGFNSAPSSHKACLLRAYLAERGLADRVRCPALPHVPGAAIEMIEREIDQAPGATLVGSSLGGFYATCLAERHGLHAVLIQPAVFPHVGLASLLGPQENLYTGERYELTAAHIDAWRALAVDPVDPERYLLLLETGDEVLDYRQAVRKYEGARMVIREGGDHTLRSFPEHLPRILAFAGLPAA